ncbi:MAG: 2-succinyl-5-enolpyruvyl-6-hydroxy-3-cyclohexene-1-carboxylic-acid synthase [Balneolaceae bacterium]
MYDPLSWTSFLFRAFYTEGIRHVFISPGSRSTPLVLGAALHPGFSKHIILDERSASFQALGAGKATGRPAILVCTSGTAAANYYPAVIEARHSGIPLIIISADRPPHLRGTGSSQTVDQIKLFGDSVLMFHELGEPAGGDEDLGRLELLARQSVFTSVENSGPVHINAPFRKPLEPSQETLKLEKARNMKQVEAPRAGQLPEVKKPAVQPFPEDVIRKINQSEKPVLFAGPDEAYRSAGNTVNALAERLNMPVFAEPGSHTGSSGKMISRYGLLLNSGRSGPDRQPDLIFRTGDEPTNPLFREIEKENPGSPVIQLLSRDTWQDSAARVDHRILLNRNLLDLSGIQEKKDAWLKSWIRLDSGAEEILEERLSVTEKLTDGHVYHFFSGIFKDSWNIMVSNSFTVRDLALFSRRSGPLNRTYVNRGAAGIDGVLSTGIGISRGKSERTAVYIGDLAFLHDSNALAGIQKLDHPVIIVVINNRGGNIFRMLPVYGRSDYYSDYFETPQEVSIPHLAKAHNLPHLLIDTREKMDSLTPGDLDLKGNLLIECRTDPAESMNLRHLLWNSDRERQSLP